MSDVDKPEEVAFGTRFNEVSMEAAKIVMARDQEGRNREVPVRAQFAHGTRTVLDIIHMKLGRAQSYATAGNKKKLVEELQDISNYALFGVIFEEDE